MSVAPKHPQRPRAARSTPSPKSVIVYASAPDVRRWIEEELAGENCVVMVAETVSKISDALDKATAQAQLLIIDIDGLNANELVELQRIREQGWTGKLICLGEVPRELRGALRVAHAIVRPFGSESLRVFVSDMLRHRDTVEIGK